MNHLTGLYYLAAIIGLGFIVRWFLANDRLPPDQPTTGLLRMERSEQPKEDADPASQKPHARRRR